MTMTHLPNQRKAIKQMSNSKANKMIMEIGATILSDEEYTGHDWQALALVVNLSFEQRAMTGYMYYSDGTFEADGPQISLLLLTS
jgi:hypothetical protein